MAFGHGVDIGNPSWNSIGSRVSISLPTAIVPSGPGLQSYRSTAIRSITFWWSTARSALSGSMQTRSLCRIAKGLGRVPLAPSDGPKAGGVRDQHGGNYKDSNGDHGGFSFPLDCRTGENVSRYVNRAHVAEAQRALKTGQSVTQSMFSAGFQTKSNLNREFLRMTGQMPNAWSKGAGLPLQREACPMAAASSGVWNFNHETRADQFFPEAGDGIGADREPRHVAGKTPPCRSGRQMARLSKLAAVGISSGIGARHGISSGIGVVDETGQGEFPQSVPGRPCAAPVLATHYLAGARGVTAASRRSPLGLRHGHGIGSVGVNATTTQRGSEATRAERSTNAGLAGAMPAATR